MGYFDASHVNRLMIRKKYDHINDHINLHVAEFSFMEALQILQTPSIGIWLAIFSYPEISIKSPNFLPNMEEVLD